MSKLRSVRRPRPEGRGIQLRRLVLVAAFIPCVPPLAAAAETWTVISVNGSGVVETPRISFDDDGFSGTTGCNRFTGSAGLDGGHLLVSGPVASTKMACPMDGLPAQEAAILRILEEGRVDLAFDPFTSRLTLRRGTDELVISPERPGAE